MLMLGMAGPALAQDNRSNSFSASAASATSAYPYAAIDRLEVCSPYERSGVDSEQQKQVRPLLEEHHDRIQKQLDRNPNASRQELGPQIHAISDETHRKIHALLTDHQKELERAMQQTRAKR